MKLYVDMDGVLVDFEGGVKKHFNNPEKCYDFIKKIGVNEFWSKVSSIDNFWEDLEPNVDNVFLVKINGWTNIQDVMV